MTRNARWTRPLPVIALVAGLVLALAAGCGQDRATNGGTETLGNSADGTGLVSVQLVAQGADAAGGAVTAAGGPLRHNGIVQLFLTFDTIRLFPALYDSAGMPPHPPGLPPKPGTPCPPDSARSIELLTDPVTVDALELAATLGTLLGELEAPAGDYSHLAVRLTAAWAMNDSGAQVPVTVAGRDSLLKIISRFTVVEGETTTISIVIDLDRSIREVPPGSGNFVLRPVLFGEVPPHGGGNGGHHGGGPGGPHGPEGPHGPGGPEGPNGPSGPQCPGGSNGPGGSGGNGGGKG